MKPLRDASRYFRHIVTTYQYPLIHLPWWQMPISGYFIGVLLVALVVILVRVFLIKEVHFLWLPFCLVSVLVGSIWGVSPALLATLLGFLAFNYIIIPQSDILSFDVWHDLRIIGPFVLAQLGIALLAAQNAVKHRRALLARQEIDTYALELTALNHQLEQTNQELERANRLKENFMTRAAHELRTPLTTILGETQLAQRRLHKQPQITPELQLYQQHFARIEARTRGLSALVEDLTMLSSVRSGEAPLHLNRCNFSELCREVVGNQRALSGRQIELLLPSDPINLHADCERLLQVVVNLVSNAISYSQEETTIHVCARVRPTHILFLVQNAGPALSIEEQAHLFEPFYRTPYAENQLRNGWGLGLAVSKEIVQHHGGHMRVTSSAKKGTVFFVQMPFEQRASGFRKNSP